mmetsp:Transcript_54238/g.162376  ORF Transcript_54238/g.162376 Transcript_54238/m.162376 type:complete len:104 (+) Transcript_54238:70-381(+)
MNYQAIIFHGQRLPSTMKSYPVAELVMKPLRRSLVRSHTISVDNAEELSPSLCVLFETPPDTARHSTGRALLHTSHHHTHVAAIRNNRHAQRINRIYNCIGDL